MVLALGRSHSDQVGKRPSHENFEYRASVQKNFFWRSKNCQNIKMISSWGIDSFELHSITIFEWKTCSFRLLITLNSHRNTKSNQNWPIFNLSYLVHWPMCGLSRPGQTFLFFSTYWERPISKLFRNSWILMQFWFKGLVIFSYFTKNDNLRSF